MLDDNISMLYFAVKLSGSSFKGFMIQARAQDGGESIGIGQFKRHPDYSRTSREVCSNDVSRPYSMIILQTI